MSEPCATIVSWCFTATVHAVSQRSPVDWLAREVFPGVLGEHSTRPGHVVRAPQAPQIVKGCCAGVPQVNVVRAAFRRVERLPRASSACSLFPLPHPASDRVDIAQHLRPGTLAEKILVEDTWVHTALLDFRMPGEVVYAGSKAEASRIMKGEQSVPSGVCSILTDTALRRRNAKGHWTSSAFGSERPVVHVSVEAQVAALREELAGNAEAQTQVRRAHWRPCIHTSTARMSNRAGMSTPFPRLRRQLFSCGSCAPRPRRPLPRGRR